jgi:hypothetical protein
MNRIKKGISYALFSCLMLIFSNGYANENGLDLSIKNNTSEVISGSISTTGKALSRTVKSFSLNANQETLINYPMIPNDVIINLRSSKPGELAASIQIAYFNQGLISPAPGAIRSGIISIEKDPTTGLFYVLFNEKRYNSYNPK